MELKNQQKILEELIAKLVAAGEDKDELWFWEEMFPALDEEQRNELIENLTKELEQLHKI